MNRTRRTLLLSAIPALLLGAAGCSSSADTGQHLDMKPPPPTGPLKGRETPQPGGAPAKPAQ